MDKIDTELYGNLLFAIFGLSVISLILCCFDKPIILNLIYFLIITIVISFTLIVLLIRQCMNETDNA